MTPAPPELPAAVAQLRHDRRTLGRALSVAAGDRGAAEAEALLRALAPWTGGARAVGVTGPPGAGKSTLVAALTRHWRAAGMGQVGVVAIDPSSPFSGGAILGDRIRMQEHHADAGVFVRSLATRGALGGLAAAAYATVRVLDAAGMQHILIETVGVGQDEVDVAQLADITVVVLVPGVGDSVQMLKAGLMEIADVFVVNKADTGGERLERDLRAALTLAAAGPGAWRPPIVLTTATTAAGVPELAAALERRWSWVADHGGWVQHRARQWERRLPQLSRERLAARLLPAVLTPARLQALAAALASGADPETALSAIVDDAVAAAKRPEPR